MGWVYVYLHTLSSVSGLNAMVYKNVHMLLRLLGESSLFNVNAKQDNFRSQNEIRSRTVYL